MRSDCNCDCDSDSDDTCIECYIGLHHSYCIALHLYARVNVKCYLIIPSHACCFAIDFSFTGTLLRRRLVQPRSLHGGRVSEDYKFNFECRLVHAFQGDYSPRSEVRKYSVHRQQPSRRNQADRLWIIQTLWTGGHDGRRWYRVSATIAIAIAMTCSFFVTVPF
jgi:hypothetical protein